MLLTKENAEKEADKIGKIEYQPNVTFTSAEIDKLDDTEYSNKTRTPFYDFNAIKKALDSNSTNDRSFRYNDKLAEACDSDVINADNVPNGQLQGIAIDNDLNIYTCSDGENNYNCRAVISVIFKSSKRTYSYNVYGDIGEMLYYLHGQVSDLELEIEGIQILNDKIYIGMAPKNQDIRNNAFIYSVELSDIHEI